MSLSSWRRRRRLNCIFMNNAAYTKINRSLLVGYCIQRCCWSLCSSENYQKRDRRTNEEETSCKESRLTLLLLLRFEDDEEDVEEEDDGGVGREIGGGDPEQITLQHTAEREGCGDADDETDADQRHAARLWLQSSNTVAGHTVWNPFEL